MISKKIRITGAQLSFPVGAIQQNKQTILDAIEVGEQNQSDIVVFPELALTGYPPEDLLLRESFVGKNFAVLEEISEFTTSTSAIIGFVDRTMAKHKIDMTTRSIANAAAIVQNGDVKGIYHKCFLPNYSVFDDCLLYTSPSPRD